MNIPPETYQARRQALAKSVKADCIVLTANHMVQKSTTEAFPFFQDSHFYYYTGIDEPGWIMVIDTFKNQEWLIKPKESYYLSIFDGEVDAADISRSSMVTDIRDNREGWYELSQLAKSRTSIATLVPPVRYSAVYGMFLNPSRRAIIEKLKRQNSALNVVDMSMESARLRVVKDKYEIALLQEAINITGTALGAVADRLQGLSNENEIDAIITEHFIKSNSQHGFPPIVASGKNATVIHYRLNRSVLEDQAYIVIDVGAEFNKYNADITRSYAFGDVSQRHKDIFSAVQDVQAQAYDLLKTGVTVRDYEAKVEQIMGRVLNDLGVISTMLRKDIRKYYPTATSHFLGLDVHDVGDYDMPLEPGVVLTVEPGIYIPEEGIGVRIEDDVVVTESGIENLSKNIPL